MVAQRKHSEHLAKDKAPSAAPVRPQLAKHVADALPDMETVSSPARALQQSLAQRLENAPEPELKRYSPRMVTLGVTAFCTFFWIAVATLLLR